MDTNKLKQFVNDRITFLFDHWTMEDKRPYTFGGWREEVVNDIVQQIQQARDEEIIEKLNIETWHEKDCPCHCDNEWADEDSCDCLRSKVFDVIKSLSNKSGGSDE